MNHTNNIFILSGPVQSGKTTRLIQWMENKNDVFGILTPIINGKRMFMDVASKEIFAMEAAASDEEVLQVGKYSFSKKGFEQADNILASASNQINGWLIIDEVGPLELNEKGFYARIIEILKNENDQIQILLVVRESILDQVLLKFNIPHYQPFKFK